MKIGLTDDRGEEATEQQPDRFKNVAGTNRFMQCGGHLLFSPIRHSDDETGDFQIGMGTWVLTATAT